ncbi:MAG: UvrD-helicase domain-containing protein [Chloroflexota bacterium]
MEYLSGCNPQQERAVTIEAGRVIVMAGPGSGKTRVLTQRIAYLVGYLGVSPHRILAVTFTNKAAREMESRVYALLGTDVRGLTLGTFHAFCARMLRREAQHLPFGQNFVIFDSDDQIDLVKRVLKDLNIDDKRYRAQGVHATISRAKNELLLPEDLSINNYRDEVVQRVYQRYQELLLSNNALDFDDLLLWAVFLLEDQPALKERYSRRFEHVLVDEFQDTNQAQYTLLRHLTAFHGNLFVVGDTDQSIYRWRGADYRNVLRFQQDYPDAQVILLEQNYRSTQNILDVAMAVIDHNPYRIPKQLFTERGRGQCVEFHQLYDDHEEANFVVDAIHRLNTRHRFQFGDFAVMYRTNAQSRLLEEAFLRAGMPYKLVGAQRFYGRREIKDIIAYLRLVHNPKDEPSLLRVINVPRRGIGTRTLTQLRTHAKQVQVTPVEVLLNLSLGAQSTYWDCFSTQGASRLCEFGSYLRRWRAIMSELTTLQLMDTILVDVAYHDYIDDGSEEGQDRWENVQELRRLAAEFDERGLEAFLEEVALVSDQDTLEEDPNAPTLLTLHAAKGLEFPVVFIVGLDDGMLPHQRSFHEPEAMEEERRLFYVGITRAEDRLFLLRAMNRSLYGYLEPTIPSRYLEEIPSNMLEGDQLDRGEAQTNVHQSLFHPRQSTATSSTAPILQPKYRAGMHVRHDQWGKGLVVSSRLEEDDEIVDIVFESVGIKRLMASVAKLETL